MNWRFCLLPALGLSLVSCAQLGGIVGSKPREKPKSDPYGLEAYRQAGGRVSGVHGGNPTAAVSSAGKPSAVGITREEDIEWAPEDPNIPIGGGLEELWKRPENKSWHTSHKEASRLSSQSGKPMLIWFTDSMHSPLCRRLSDELFSKSEFEDWASGRLVRLRVDTTIPAKERHADIGVRKSRYVEKLKKRYGVHGHPTVLVLSPRGAVVSRYRGYRKGGADYYWGRIKQAVTGAEEDYGEWREKMEKRGYRLWTNRGGRKTFAKLHRFHSGRVTLVSPNGRRGITSFRKLSDADQAWILLQKKEYDARRRR